MSDDREPIIDALLEELLGEQQPPDLTQRILGAHDAATESSVDVARLTNGSTKHRSFAAADELSSNDQHDGKRTVNKKTKTTTRKRRNWQAWASVAIVLVGASVFFAWLQLTGGNFDFSAKVQPPPVETPSHPPSAPDLGDAYASAEKSVPDDEEDEYHNQEDYFPNAPAIDQEPSNTPSTLFAQNDSTSGESIADPQFAFDPFANPDFERELQLDQPVPMGKLIGLVNRSLESKWRQVLVEPLPSVNDLQWFYRAVGFLFGRAPKSTEVEWFRKLGLDRERAIDRMVTTRQFNDRWAAFFANVLTGSSSNKKPIAKEEFRQYLFDSLREGKPYDQLAFELITAAGSNRASESDFNPATNFLLGHRQIEWPTPNRSEPLHKIGATEKVTQVFLGMQLQCARCHDHNGVTQQQYYEMVSFFTQMRPIKPSDSSNVWRLSNADYPGANKQRKNFDDADVFFTKMQVGEDAGDDQLGVSVYPAFLDGREVPNKSGRVAVINRREALAKFIVSSDQFPKSLVNRIWDEAFGYGFTQPIEDMGEHNPPSHPQLLESLATNFRNSGFDIKPLVKWIALSKAFDRRSRVESDGLVGRPDAFSSFARLDRDLLYGRVANAMYETLGVLREGGPSNVNAKVSGQEKGKKLSPQKRARLQARINAKKQFIKSHYGSMFKQLARSEELTDLQRVIHVFLATVGRLPLQNERDRGVEIIAAKRNAELGMQEICLVLLNSEEFVDQH